MPYKNEGLFLDPYLFVMDWLQLCLGHRLKQELEYANLMAELGKEEWWYLLKLLLASDMLLSLTFP